MPENMEVMIAKKSTAPADSNSLLRPGEVAKLFRVDPRTARVWADTGLVECIRTPNGHRRYNRDKIYELLGGNPADKLLLPQEVATVLRVDPITVVRWIEQSKLEGVKTPGGHHRIKESTLRSILEQ